MKKVIYSKKSPEPAKFFSQAILTSSKYKLEIAGQIWLNRELWKLVEWWVKEETKQIFKNIENILEEIWWNLENITKCRVFLTLMNDYKEMNDFYETKFQNNAPARIAVAVKELPLWALVEIECVAEWDEINEKYL